MSTIHPSTTRRRRLGALGMAVVVGASGALVAATPLAAPAGAAAPTYASGTLDWGVKASFRAYVPTGGGGSISTTAGATTNGDGTYHFVGGSAASETSAGFTGSVQFLAHGGALDFTISDPRVSISGTPGTSGASGTLTVDAVSKSLSTSAYETYDDVAFATLDLSGVTPTEVGTTRTFANIPAVLTAAGAPAFAGFYSAGTALDPVTFTQIVTPPAPVWTPQVTFSKTSGINPAGEVITVSGTGFNPAANISTRPPVPVGMPTGIYVVFGKFQNAWAPSAGAASSTRQVIDQKWPLPAASKAAAEAAFGPNGQYVVLNADGSFTTTLFVKADATKTNPNYGIATYSAGGAAANASQETFQGVSFATAADGAVPSVTVGDKTVVETGASQVVQVPVSLNALSATPVSVEVATADATATSGSDYSLTSTTVTFAPGEATKNVAVTVLGDGISEKAEKFSVKLRAPSGLTIGDPAATVNVLDDDAPISVYVSDVALSEGTSGAVNANFAVTLSRQVPVGATVTVPVATTSGTATAGTDYSAVADTLVFGAGESSKLVEVAVVGDTDPEKNETFSLKASGIVGAVNGDPVGKATIVNDDGTPGAAPGPSLAIGDATIIEGNSGTSAVTLTVALAAASASAVTVDVATANASAVAGSDYTAVSTSLTFAAGETTKSVTVPVVGDVASEKNEKFSVKLSGAVGAVVGDAVATVNVLDNDAPLSISVADVVATEGTTATFTVALSAPVPAGSSVTVSATTEDGTAKSALSDYVPAGSSLTFAAGEQYKVVTVVVPLDVVAEANETFKLRLALPAGALLADAIAVATVVDVH